MSSIASLRPFTIVLVAAAAALLMLLLSASGAWAAPNPSGQGQPTANCETSLTGPNGFQTGGFAHAVEVYAGVGHSTVSNNPKAVSQYDVACYQLSNKSH